MKTLASFQNLHQGETLIVCGCGESLNELVCPERFVTIGVNDVGRKFQPDYLVVVNPPNQFSGDRFHYVKTSQAKHLFTQLDLNVPHPGVVKFQLGAYGGTDFSNPRALNYTQNSPYVALCLAAHMGAKRIGLVGVDFTDNHFFARTGRHALSPQFALIDEQYRRLCDALRARGVEVFNLSSTSRLSAFPKISLEEFTNAGATLSAPDAEDADLAPLKFVSYATMPVAGVPAILARCIGARTPHSARAMWAQHGYSNGVAFKGDIAWMQKPAEAEAALAEADVVIVHNGKVEPHHQALLKGKAVITMAHNYLWNVDQSFVQRGFPGVVVGQYQATLPEFAGWSVVPNPVPLWEEEYQPGAKHADVSICYTPYGKHERYPPGHKLYWHAKGYDTTMRVLDKLAADFSVRLEVIRDAQVSHAESLAMKRRAHIVIDECVTGSYHRNSLEGLAAGCVVVNGVGLLPEVADVLRHCAGQDSEFPFVFAGLDNLEEVLTQLVERGAASLLEAGARNRLWMEQRWDFTQQWERFWLTVVGQALKRAGRAATTIAASSQPVAASARVARNGGMSMSAGTEGVSVIIPHGGRERLPHLRAMLANLRQCEGVSEVIVVEMGTTAFAEDIARRWAHKYVFSHHEGAFERAGALNLGSAFAEYDLLLWMDNDLIVPKEYIKRAAADLRSRGLDYLVPFYDVRYLSMQDSKSVMTGARNPVDCKAVNVLGGHGGTAELVRRSFYLKYGGMTEGFRGWGGEDNAWVHKAALLGKLGFATQPEQRLYHLYHQGSGGYGGEAHKEHPYYEQNVALMNEIYAIRDPQIFLQRFPPPQHFPCPWPEEKRISFVSRRDETQAHELAERTASQFQSLFGATVELVNAGDGKAKLAKQWKSNPPDAAVVFSARLALSLLGQKSSAVSFEKLVIVVGTEDELTAAEQQKLKRAGAILATDESLAAELFQSGLRAWQWERNAATEANAHSFALALAQPLSTSLGKAAAEQPQPQELKTTSDKQKPEKMKLPVWLYWEGACPDWIKACQETILAHAPDAQLLTPESFDKLRDVDRDIDLNRLQAAHRADFIRAFLLTRYGGLWLDSDCLLMQPLQPLLDKLGEYDFLAHRERNGYISNGFIGARPGSRIAAELYKRLCQLLRSRKPLGWISLGGQPLTEIINHSPADWLELPCESVQPICWSQPQHFFTIKHDAEHARAYNEQAICYMLSNNSIQKYKATRRSANLLAQGSFFRYLQQRSLNRKNLPATVNGSSNGASKNGASKNEASRNGAHRWQHIPFCLETISQVSPVRVLDLDVGLGRWGMLLRDLYEKKPERSHWQMRLEGVTESAEKLLEHHRFFYDQIHVGEAAAIIEEVSQTWDLTIFGAALKKWPRAKMEKALHEALDKSAYVLVSTASENGSDKEKPANGNGNGNGNGHSNGAQAAESLRSFLASRPEYLKVRHERGAGGEEIFLLSQTDPKKLRPDSGLQNIFTGLHRHNLRLNEESVSGPGSGLAQTFEIRQRLPLLVSAFDIKSLLDAACGDFNWLQAVNLRLEEYIGADILPELISQNQSRHAASGRRFVKLDITTDLLPQVDLILCRDCLVHFSYAEIERALRNFKASGSKYVLLTTFTNKRTNIDIANGDWRPLNFQEPPFNFPAPLSVINEKCIEGGKAFSDKSLGLWLLSDLFK